MNIPTSFPSFVYHATEPPVVVHSKEAFEALPNPGEWLATPYVPPPPVLTALEPASVVLGMPSFTLAVRGTGFTADAVIVFAGHEEPTTVVSATEVTTGVNMDLWHGADRVAVVVQQGALVSNELSFEFLAEAARSTRRRDY